MLNQNTIVMNAELSDSMSSVAKAKYTTCILELKHLDFSFMLILDATVTFKGFLLYRRVSDLAIEDTIVIFCFQPASLNFCCFW